MKLIDLSTYRDLVIKDIEAHAEWREEVQHGKMFGFAVCESLTPLSPSHEREGASHTIEGDILLKAYSGQILGRSDWEGYVPAIYDYLQPDGYFKTHEAEITAINNKVKEVQKKLSVSSVNSVGDKKNSSVGNTRSRELEELKHERKERSQALQRWLFSQFKLTSPTGETGTVLKVFSDYAHRTGSKQVVPPGGTGECCAPKLLNYANTHGLKVLHLAEFWYGDSPKGIIRHHGKFYEPCQAKCVPIIGFMGYGLRFMDKHPQSASQFSIFNSQFSILYEDEWFVAINKPPHLLSVPGKRQLPNAQDMLCEQIGKPVRMTHRLDMDTSGILLSAKTEEAFVAMQRLFATHEEVKKEYIAVVSSNNSNHSPSLYNGRGSGGGSISLPLAPDFLNRPMQKVDYEEGKEAITEYEFVSNRIPPLKGEVRRVLLLRPLTGRTHQLRVHCAHPDGLGMPIVGDPLYGNIPNDRMLLHASKLTFRHPFTGDIVTIESKPDFL